MLKNRLMLENRVMFKNSAKSGSMMAAVFVTVGLLVAGCGDSDSDSGASSESEGPASTVEGAAGSSSGMVVGGGLTVSEALATEATGVLAVKGHLFDEGAGPALCETLVGQGERYGCDGPLLPVEGLDLESVRDDVIVHDGLTYTETEISVLGELVDGALVIDGLAN